MLPKKRLKKRPNRVLSKKQQNYTAYRREAAALYRKLRILKEEYRKKTKKEPQNIECMLREIEARADLISQLDELRKKYGFGPFISKRFKK